MEALFAAIDPVGAPRWAASLLRRFGTLQAAFAVSHQQRCEVLGADHRPAVLLTTMHGAMLDLLHEGIEDRPLIATDGALIDYVRAGIVAAPVETVRALFLNSRNRLIGDEEICRGTVDQVSLYIREIARRALDVGASGVILAHNHPSGNAAPSIQDKAFTRDLNAALATMGISLVDHLIVAASGTTSLRKLGII